MSTKPRILWVEEDYLDAFQMAMESKGYDVTRAFFLSKAVQDLEKSAFDVLLLDVMMPIEEEDIAIGFTPEATRGGNESGLEFFRRYNEKILDSKVPVLVYTILGNVGEVREKFIRLGLNPRHYIDKVGSSNVNALLEHVGRALRNKPTDATLTFAEQEKK